MPPTPTQRDFKDVPRGWFAVPVGWTLALAALLVFGRGTQPQVPSQPQAAEASSSSVAAQRPPASTDTRVADDAPAL